jgi:hypothetical protein
MFSDGDSHCCAFLILLVTKNPDHVKSQFFVTNVHNLEKIILKMIIKKEIFVILSNFICLFLKMKILESATSRPSLFHFAHIL